MLIFVCFMSFVISVEPLACLAAHTRIAQYYFFLIMSVEESYLWAFPDSRVMVKTPNTENHSHS
jgi:hypothetical protein